jgi:hypothetical protein
VWDMAPDREAEKRIVEAHREIFAPLAG